MEDHSLAYSRPVRIIILILYLAAISFWVYTSFAFVSVILDYPLRRAGENSQYPPLHTFGFFRNYAWLFSKALFQTSHVWLIPFVVTMMGLCFGPKIQSYLKRTFIILTALLAPIIVSAIYWIFIVY